MRGLTDRIGSARQFEDSSDAEINMAPLIDMIFILLIFFLVTASFVRESGVKIQRPEAATAEKKETSGMMIGVTKEGEVFIENSQVDIRSVRGLVEIFLMENAGGGVMIEADQKCYTGTLVQVLDQCRMAGAKDVAVSAVKKSQ